MKLEGPLLASPLTIQNEGSETLFQQLTLSGYPRQAPVARGSGMTIRREFLGMNGQALDIKALKSGDLVLVHLAVTANTQVPDALVVDLLPAGLELENQNLAQSAASLENASSAVKQWRESMQNAAVVHQEFRDDRYVAALSIDQYSTTHLLYLARAVTRGPTRYRRRRSSRCTGRTTTRWANRLPSWWLKAADTGRCGSGLIRSHTFYLVSE